MTPLSQYVDARGEWGRSSSSPPLLLLAGDMAVSKWQQALALFMAVTTFVVTMLFTCGAFGHEIGLFADDSFNISEKFNLEKWKLEVTPADWTILLTPFIYVTQGVWLVYGVSVMCRKMESGYMYEFFPVLPPIMYVVFSFSLACNVAWLLIWDKEYMEVALVFINLMTCTLYICLVVSLRRLNEFGHLMVRSKLNKDIWVIRMLVQNGLGLYASWGTVAAVFNFAIVLTYKTGMANDKENVGSTVSLIIFSMEVFAWFIVDNFFCDKLLRYLFTPYLTILVCLIGIIHKNYDFNNKNSVYTMLLFLTVFLMTVFKVIISTWRHFKHPLFSHSNSKLRRPVVSFEVRNLLEP